MNTLLKTLPFVALLAFTGPGLAQTSTERVEEDEAPDAMALSMGEEETDGLGSVYIESEFTDWELRCIRSEAEVDPCQLYQLINDSSGNPIAEINIFPLIGQEAAAGATVVTPLETLLTENLRMSVDGGAAKVYPFSWCSQIGCFSRLGLSNDDIASFRRGNVARLSIVPVVAPDQRVNLEVSLSGFTAAFTAALEKVEAAAAAAEAAQE